jgi:hypothetical protein
MMLLTPVSLPSVSKIHGSVWAYCAVTSAMNAPSSSAPEVASPPSSAPPSIGEIWLAS